METKQTQDLLEPADEIALPAPVVEARTPGDEAAEAATERAATEGVWGDIPTGEAARIGEQALRIIPMDGDPVDQDRLRPLTIPRDEDVEDLPQ